MIEQARREIAAADIESHRDTIAAKITVRTFVRHPELTVRYGAAGRDRCLEDAHFHLRYLTEALRSGRPSVFAEYVSWAKIMLAERRVPESDLRANLEELLTALRESIDAAHAEIAAAYVAAALETLRGAPDEARSYLSLDAPHGELASLFLQALLRSDRNEAARLIEEAVGRGVPVREIYLHVFQESQREVGRLWQTNRITVAHEHYCTAATQLIMTRLYPRIFTTPRVGRTFIGFCVGGELHEMGMRIVCDFFEMDGWDTHYLGANLPREHFLRYLAEAKADVVGLSATMPYHVREIASLVAAIRQRMPGQNIKVLVGGYPFLKERDLWRDVGADGFAADAAGSVTRANELVS